MVCRKCWVTGCALTQPTRHHRPLRLLPRLLLAAFLADFLAAGLFFTAAFALRAAFFFPVAFLPGRLGAAILPATLAPTVFWTDGVACSSFFSPDPKATAKLCGRTHGAAVEAAAEAGRAGGFHA